MIRNSFTLPKHRLPQPVDDFRRVGDSALRCKKLRVGKAPPTTKPKFFAKIGNVVSVASVTQF
jgi:hypothetical protein